MTVAQYIIGELQGGVEKELVKNIMTNIRLNEITIDSVCGCRVLRSSFLKEYQTIEPIEKMPEDEKKEFKQYIIQMFPGKDKQVLTENAKIIYTISHLL